MYNVDYFLYVNTLYISLLYNAKYANKHKDLSINNLHEVQTYAKICATQRSATSPPIFCN